MRVSFLLASRQLHSANWSLCTFNTTCYQTTINLIEIEYVRDFYLCPILFGRLRASPSWYFITRWHLNARHGSMSGPCEAVLCLVLALCHACNFASTHSYSLLLLIIRHQQLTPHNIFDVKFVLRLRCLVFSVYTSFHTKSIESKIIL